MPVLSYVHQLFNADQCQSYIHTLRWKEVLIRYHFDYESAQI
jgi:hypothetical protein